MRRAVVVVLRVVVLRWYVVELEVELEPRRTKISVTYIVLFEMTTPTPTWLKVGLVCDQRMFWQCSEEFMNAVWRFPTGSVMLLGPMPTFSPYSLQPETEFHVLESCQTEPFAAICWLCFRATATRAL